MGSGDQTRSLYTPVYGEKAQAVLPLLAPLPVVKANTPGQKYRLWLALFAFLLILIQLFSGRCIGFDSSSPTTVPPSRSHAGDLSELPDLYEASLIELQAGLSAGNYTSIDLVKAYFARIAEVNLAGPSLRAVLEQNPSALAQAQLLDEERKFFGSRGLMHGIPILLKDNIATVFSEGMNTTAGSYTLVGSVVQRDAGVVTRLRKAGAIILGKANMCEFAHARGDLASGWSGRGGQTTAAYYPGQNPCGSSGGSGVATSIGLTPVSLGTETDGSITCPSSFNNIVGIKPTVGLTSRAGVVPIFSFQDTVGPMARSVADAAAVLSVIAGLDRLDNYTDAAPAVIPDYTQALRLDALHDKRLGVPRHMFLNSSITNMTQPEREAFENALHTLRDLGATIVDPADMPSADELLTEKFVSLVGPTAFKAELDAYYAGLFDNPSGVRTVAQITDFNAAHPELERPTGYEDQTYLMKAANASDRTPEFHKALAKRRSLGREQGIDWVVKKHNLDAIVLPANGYSYHPSAIAGYPVVTVPLGFFPNDTIPQSTGPSTFYPAPGAPFGLAFIGGAWSEFDLIGFAYAYEQATQTRRIGKPYEGIIPKTQLADIIGQ